MKELVVIAVMAVAVTVYANGRGYRAPSALGDFPPYQGSRHRNRGLGYGGVPPISPYENVQPSNEGTPTAIAPSTPATTDKPSQHSAVSSTDSAITQVHTSATSEPKMASTNASLMATMATAKSDTLADAATTTVSTSTVSTAATDSGAAMQSSNSADSSAALTTEASLSVADTESPITFVGRQAIDPDDFQASTFLPPSYYLSNGVILNQSLSGASKKNASSKIRDFALNLAFPKESKSVLKEKLQSSLLKYLPQQESRRGQSFLQPAIAGTVDCIPLAALTGRPKIAAPSAPIATLSAVLLYRPWAAFGQSSVFNSLPGGISGGISAGIPGNMSPGVPASIPTLNFGQNFQHVGQLRQLEPARSEPCSTGISIASNYIRYRLRHSIVRLAIRPRFLSREDCSRSWQGSRVAKITPSAQLIPSHEPWTSSWQKWA
ncbi:unnamed protein product [Xylocopa violacea]|uniref:Uncharacterized protein n=1 Tax=Xylocopa violacea TaxID=135666 RepID=A0ABP1NJ88_XYLVO